MLKRIFGIVLGLHYLCTMKGDTIIIKGARENNLKDVSLEIPKHQITVFTGVSGSGKSSLVLDTIAAKSRRELNDTFPSFVQQYLPKYGRPHVDAIENLPIAIVIDQKKPAQNSRSTVATYTDIAALLRLLFSRVGQPFVGYAESFSSRRDLAAMVSSTSELLPEPDTPVNTVIWCLGISSDTSFRLFSRAPRMMILSYFIGVNAWMSAKLATILFMWTPCGRKSHKTAGII